MFFPYCVSVFAMLLGDTIFLDSLDDANAYRHEVKQYPIYIINTVSSRYLKVEVHPKLLISQSKFSGPRKFTLRLQ